MAPTPDEVDDDDIPLPGAENLPDDVKSGDLGDFEPVVPPVAPVIAPEPDPANGDTDEGTEP